MAAGAMTDMADFASSVLDQALERRHADIGRCLPNRNIQVGLVEPIENGAAGIVFDRGERQAGGTLASRVAGGAHRRGRAPPRPAPRRGAKSPPNACPQATRAV